MSSKNSELFHFVLILKKENPGSINIISFLLCFVSWVFFLYFSFAFERFSTFLFWASWSIPLVLVWRVKNKRKTSRLFNYKYPLFVTGCVWLFFPGMRWVTLLFLFFILMDNQARRPLEIGVSDERIVINTFFRKKFQWSEFSNVVLKGGLLTLDFVNNRIIQRETIPQRDLSEEVFNEFCREQIISHQR